MVGELERRDEGFVEEHLILGRDMLPARDAAAWL
jgi:hypothetical protein